MENSRKLAIKIIDEFEELLAKYDIKLPSNEREENEKEACIFGTDYYDLEDKITEIINEELLTKNRRNYIMNYSNFKMCNGHTFEEIKEKSIEELDYEKAHDLAYVENIKYGISVYLGVYDDKFDLTYSIDSKKNFYDDLENITSEEINIDKINNIQELEKVMKMKLGVFLVENLEQIKKLSKKLDKECIEDENDECL